MELCKIIEHAGGCKITEEHGSRKQQQEKVLAAVTKLKKLLKKENCADLIPNRYYDSRLEHDENLASAFTRAMGKWGDERLYDYTKPEGEQPNAVKAELIEELYGVATRYPCSTLQDYLDELTNRYSTALTPEYQGHKRPSIQQVLYSQLTDWFRFYDDGHPRDDLCKQLSLIHI